MRRVIRLHSKFFLCLLFCAYVYLCCYSCVCVLFCFDFRGFGGVFSVLFLFGFLGECSFFFGFVLIVVVVSNSCFGVK